MALITPQIIRRFKAAEPGSAARAQFDLDCVDPLGRSALSIAIINENPEMMEVLLENRIQVDPTSFVTLKSFALTRIIMCFGMVAQQLVVSAL